jgi:hypothetical protein
LAIYEESESLCAAVAPSGYLREFRKEETMITTRKIVLSAAIVLSTVFALATTAAFANAPGGAYIQCDDSKSSPVRRTPDSW